MLRGFAVGAVSGIMGIIGGALLLGAADHGLAQAPAPKVAEPFSLASSAIGSQTFLWALDASGHTIIFCYSNAANDTGPQYDFGCKSRSLEDAMQQ